VYFAMAFSFGVELLNLRARRKAAPMKLRQAQLADLLGEPRGHMGDTRNE
jgi:hypothetical protein